MSEPKKHRRFVRLADSLIIIATIGAVVYGIVNLLSNDSPDICKSIGKRYELQLQDGNFTQERVSMQRCDRVVVVNLDNQTYSLNFGTHDNLIDYPGFEPQVIAPNEAISIDMLAAGTYRLHDHLRNKASVALTVQERD